MNIFFNTCVFGAHLCDLQSTLRYEEIRSAWKNSSFSFARLVLPLLLSDRTTSVYLDAALVVVCSSVRIINDILWDQSFILFGNSKLCAFYYRRLCCLKISKESVNRIYSQTRPRFCF